MAQNIEYRIAILDEYGCPRSLSQCGKCILLEDGVVDFICKKHLNKIPAEFWNNEKKCSGCVVK